MKGAKIFVVDDDKYVLDLVHGFLECNGFEVTALDCAQEALKTLQESQPHIVLTDINMPGMDGVELAREIKRNHPRISVIMMTGSATDERIAESLSLGVDDCIRKPFIWDRVVASIRASLAKRAATAKEDTRWAS